jgi:hypothetical protein
MSNHPTNQPPPIGESICLTCISFARCRTKVVIECSLLYEWYMDNNWMRPSEYDDKKRKRMLSVFRINPEDYPVIDVITHSGKTIVIKKYRIQQ